MVRAEDRAGNSTSVTRTITVDRTAPTVAIGEPGAAVNPDATMRVYATWGEPAAFVKILVDGGLVDAREVEGAISMSYPLGARPGWAEGSTHTFRVEVTDRAGNVGHATRTSVVDRAAPTVTLDPPRCRESCPEARSRARRRTAPTASVPPRPMRPATRRRRRQAPSPRST